MENEVLLMQRFEEIEQKVERLIAICSTLEDKNRTLKSINTELELEIHDKTSKLQNLSEERIMIRSKIDMLLVKLEDIVEKDSNSSI
jgi:hypothetical protein